MGPCQNPDKKEVARQRFLPRYDCKLEHFEQEMEMNYDEFVSYLLKKYGPAKYDYFTNATCKTKSKRISRTKEGLFCHHIDEDKGYMLSHTGCALEQPFEYQKAERLVYCNYIEHLLLHILIGKNAFWSKHQKLIVPKQFSYFIVPGVSYICSEINLLYDQNGSSVEWRNRCFKEIENNFESSVYISAKNNTGLKELENAVKNILGVEEFDSSAPLIANQRQKLCIQKAYENISEALSATELGLTYDAVNVMIDSAVDELLALTGKKATEEVVNNIFSRFCVGK